MNPKKQNADFLHVGRKLIDWYKIFGRDLPFRKTKNPYNIWICEIIFQQTRISQGLNHYNRFIERFPDVQSLAKADADEVLLYWKGLGYYSRAINLHHAARQILSDFDGKFPDNYEDILKLKGVGKYTAAAVSSICFGAKIPAVDGNFYRVLSRLFADDFDISSSQAFRYFSEIALRMMPETDPGIFNEAVMDLGSEICTPRNPKCAQCPLNENCAAFQTGKIDLFPFKSKKVKVQDLLLTYYFVSFEDRFLVQQRGDGFIWKKLFEFPDEINEGMREFITGQSVIQHKLTHRNLQIEIFHVEIEDEELFIETAARNGLKMVTFEDSAKKSFPKPLENYILKHDKSKSKA